MPYSAWAAPPRRRPSRRRPRPRAPRSRSPSPAPASRSRAPRPPSAPPPRPAPSIASVSSLLPLSLLRPTRRLDRRQQPEPSAERPVEAVAVVAVVEPALDGLGVEADLEAQPSRLSRRAHGGQDRRAGPHAHRGAP